MTVQNYKDDLLITLQIQQIIKCALVAFDGYCHVK